MMRTLTIAAMVLWTGVAQAQITIGYTTTFPGNEVIYGCPVTFYVKGLPRTPNGLRWEFRSRGDCVTGFKPFPGINMAWTHRVNVNIPGTFEVRCTITYPFDRATGTTPKPDVKSIDIAIPPPDGVRFVTKSPSAPIGTDIPIHFTLTCKGKPACSALGRPQELLLNVLKADGRKVRYPDAWGPTAPTPRFYRSGTAIVDLKKAWATPAWFKLPEGKFETATQHLRIVIPDLCLRPVSYPLGSVQIEWIKDSQTTYHLVHK